MQQIPVQAIANQSFAAILDNNTWEFVVKYTEGVMSVSIVRNDVALIDGARAVSGSFLIPSRYEESGNFLFVTQNSALPIFTEFNVTQSLVYVSAAELAALRVPPTPPVTSAYFNPVAALPQRFKPMGY